MKDDNALLVSGLIIEGGLGPTMLVIREGDFKRLAEQVHHDGRPIFSARFAMDPRERNRFFEFLIPIERLIERFGMTAAIPGAPAPGPPPMWRSDIGFLGEAETIRLLAEAGNLNLFRPFPDLETSELVVLDLSTRGVLGLQIKTIGVDPAHPAGTIGVRGSSFRPSPTTYFVVLAWQRKKHNFHDECLLVPSGDVRAICKPHESEGHMSFDWHPGSKALTHLDGYRISRAMLAPRLVDRLGS